MRACVQRVTRAKVTAIHATATDESGAREMVGQIGQGLLVLLGVGHEDAIEDARQLAEKIVALRIFEDEAGKMNRSLHEIGGELLAVSQFTLWGDCRKGRRPSFTAAAPPEIAEALYEEFVRAVAALGIRVATGRFRAQMEVELINDGPVTMLLDTSRLF